MLCITPEFGLYLPLEQKKKENGSVVLSYHMIDAICWGCGGLASSNTATWLMLTVHFLDVHYKG